MTIAKKEFSINLVTGSIVIQFDEQTIYDGRDGEKDLVWDAMVAGRGIGGW